MRFLIPLFFVGSLYIACSGSKAPDLDTNMYKSETKISEITQHKPKTITPPPPTVVIEEKPIPKEKPITAPKVEPQPVTPAMPEVVILPIQRKYGALLGIPATEITNIPLYRFIDSWENTPYKMGGENNAGIDCSFFAQFLYHDVYNVLIERTAEKQFSAPSTDKFIGQEFLKEGDLLFFNKQGSQYEKITHVGIYLEHDKFVHSTSRRSPITGKDGVQISNFLATEWQERFVAAGRKSNVKH